MDHSVPAVRRMSRKYIAAAEMRSISAESLQESGVMPDPCGDFVLYFLVLSVLSRQNAYSYQISQTVKKVSNSRYSTLYPVLRRLLENGWAEAWPLLKNV